jgi:hypothetical protein
VSFFDLLSSPHLKMFGFQIALRIRYSSELSPWERIHQQKRIARKCSHNFKGSVSAWSLPVKSSCFRTEGDSNPRVEPHGAEGTPAKFTADTGDQRREAWPQAGGPGGLRRAASLIAGINNLSRSLSASNRQTRMLFLGASGGRIKGCSRRRGP